MTPRAVIQLYPETPEQMELISKTATKCGFTGGLVVDYPNRFALYCVVGVEGWK